MDRKDFITAATASGVCSKSIAIKYANLKPYGYNFDSYKDIRDVFRFNEVQYKPAHIIVNPHAGRMNDYGDF